MPVFMNPLAFPILFPVHLSMLLLRQMSAIRLPFIVNLLMNPLLMPFQIRTLPRIDLTLLNPLANPVLLFRHPRIRPEAVPTH